MINYFKCFDDCDDIIGTFHGTSPKHVANQALTKLIEVKKLQPNGSVNFKIIEYAQNIPIGKYFFKGTRTELQNKISLCITGTEDKIIIDHISTVVELPQINYDDDGNIIIDVDTDSVIDMTTCDSVLLKI